MKLVRTILIITSKKISCSKNKSYMLTPQNKLYTAPKLLRNINHSFQQPIQLIKGLTNNDDFGACFNQQIQKSPKPKNQNLNLELNNEEKISQDSKDEFSEKSESAEKSFEDTEVPEKFRKGKKFNLNEKGQNSKNIFIVKIRKLLEEPKFVRQIEKNNPELIEDLLELSEYISINIPNYILPLLKKGERRPKLTNRISARHSRLRKKLYLKLLEEKVKFLSKEVKFLLYRIKS